MIMKISEITLTKHLKHVADKSGPHVNWSERQDAPTMLQHILEKNGWHMLGKGAEGAVAEHPQKAYVLKIFEDASYYQYFVQFVQQHASNPHLPKFSRYVKQVPGVPFLYVRMEKLVPIDNATLKTQYMNHLLEMAIQGLEHHINMLGGSTQDMVTSWLHAHNYFMNDLRNPQKNQEIFDLAGGVPPESWSEVLTLMAESSKQLNLKWWDMHAGNFMRRGKMLVIADPFYSD
jgi:hypothetical protein